MCIRDRVYVAYSFANVFQYNPGDIHFCTADIGWVTGHSYIAVSYTHLDVYKRQDSPSIGGGSKGATSLMRAAFPGLMAREAGHPPDGGLSRRRVWASVLQDQQRPIARQREDMGSQRGHGGEVHGLGTSRAAAAKPAPALDRYRRRTVAQLVATKLGASHLEGRVDAFGP